MLKYLFVFVFFYLFFNVELCHLHSEVWCSFLAHLPWHMAMKWFSHTPHMSTESFRFSPEICFAHQEGHNLSVCEAVWSIGGFSKLSAVFRGGSAWHVFSCTERFSMVTQWCSGYNCPLIARGVPPQTLTSLCRVCVVIFCIFVSVQMVVYPPMWLCNELLLSRLSLRFDSCCRLYQNPFLGGSFFLFLFFHAILNYCNCTSWLDCSRSSGNCCCTMWQIFLFIRTYITWAWTGMNRNGNLISWQRTEKQ